MIDHHDNDEPPDLLGLVTGELSRDETVAVARHLQSCETCTRELIDLVVANAALRSSDRVDRVLSERDEPAVIAPDEPLPPLPASFAADTSDASEAAGEAPRSHARRRAAWQWAAAAAIAVLLLTTGALAVAAHRGTTGAEVASAPLHTIKAPAGASGTVAVFARRSTRTLEVDARNLPSPSARYFYEVWLLDPRTQKMLPMGVLAPSGRGQYSVSAGIMDGYSAVDISLQANNGDPAHSDTSVLRAYL